MAVADTLNTLITDLTNAYTTLENKGADIPTNKNTNNLAEAIQSLNVGNITSEVITKTLDVESSTNITFNTTKGQIPKLIILTNANYDTDGYSNFQSGEIRYVIYYTPMNRGICGTNNRVNGQTQNALVSPLNGSADMKPIISQSSVGFTRRSNTYYLANVEYKLTCYYWEDSQKTSTITATSDMTNAQQVSNFLKNYAEDNAYTIFTTTEEDASNLPNNGMLSYTIRKQNGTTVVLGGSRYRNGVQETIPQPTSNAYDCVLNNGDKVYRTVIPLDGRVYKDTSDIDNLIAGTMPNVEFESVKSIGANFFQNNQTIKSVSFPNATNTGYTAFYDCKQLESIYFPKATTINSYSFRNCVKLTNVKLESATTLNDYCFQGCLGLETMNLPKCTYISLTAFVGGLSKFDTLVLGSDTVCALAGIGAFVNTPFRNGTGGTVYVPSSLVSSYESATNWKSLESTTFAAIEDNIATLEALGLNVDEYKS